MSADPQLAISMEIGNGLAAMGLMPGPRHLFRVMKESSEGVLPARLVLRFVG
jgi:hypothetical protein